jgi:hypothetical protein
MATVTTQREILIVRDPKFNTLFNVVLADFSNETVQTLESRVEYDEAVKLKEMLEDSPLLNCTLDDGVQFKE